jgi:hypothetical protein
MSVLLVGGPSQLRVEIADGLLQSVAPAFRRTARATPASGLPSTLLLAARIFCARRRSTVVVSTAGSDWRATSRLPGRRRLQSILTRLFFHPDLVLVLDSQNSATQETAGRATDNHANLNLDPRRICLHAHSSPERIITDGTRILVDWLASRLERRLTGSGSSIDRDSSFDPVALPVQLPSTGSD